MANKRQLKKSIAAVCGELASEILLAYYMTDSVDRATVDSIVCDIAELQSEALSNATFAYDKVSKDFANRAEYNKARHQYNVKAYAKLREDFNTKALAIVKAMNAAVPADARELVNKLG